jgi:hypothetical protein
MENSKSLEDQITDLEAKANWCDDIAKDARERAFWSMARFAANEANIARANIRGLKAGLNAINKNNS